MKYSFLENKCYSLQPACSELHAEEPSSDFAKAAQLRVGFKKSSQQTRTRYLHGLLDPGKKIFVSENNGTCQVEPFMLHCFEFLSETDFINFYSDIRETLRSHVYSRHFIDFFFRHMILCNTIS